MSEKEKKKTTTPAAAKTGEKTSTSKPSEKSTGKSSERSLKKDSSRPTIEKKGSKANVGEKEKSVEPIKSKSKKTLEATAVDGDKKDKTAPAPTIPKEISDILKSIADETNGIVKSYLDTLEAIVKEIHLEQSIKTALETGFSFYRIQDLLLRGAAGAIGEIHTVTSRVLGVSLSKLKSKTKTLHSSLTKQSLSSEEVNRRKIEVEKTIIATLMQKCKEEEAKEDKTFIVVHAEDDDDFERKLAKALESRSEPSKNKPSLGNSQIYSEEQKTERSVNLPIDVKVFVASARNLSEYRQEIAKGHEFETYSSKVKMTSLGDIKLPNVGRRLSN